MTTLEEIKKKLTESKISKDEISEVFLDLVIETKRHPEYAKDAFQIIAKCGITDESPRYIAKIAEANPTAAKEYIEDISQLWLSGKHAPDRRIMFGLARSCPETAFPKMIQLITAAEVSNTNRGQGAAVLADMMENDSQNGRDIATKVVKIADELVSNRKDERLDFLAGYGMLSAAAKANHDVAPASLSVLRKMQSMNQCDAETLKDVAWACKEIALSIPKYTSEASEIILNGMQSDKNDDNDKGYKEPYGYGRVRNYVCSWFNAALYLRKLNPSIDQGLEVWKKASESGEYGSLIKTVDSHTLYLMAQAAPNQVFQLAKKELDPKNRKHNDVSEVIALTGISEAIKANPKLASKGIEIIRQSLPKAKKLADAFDVLREIGAANPEVGDQAIAAIEERLSKRKMDRMTTESALQNVMKIRDAQTRQEAGSRIERLRNRILAHDGENVSTPKPVKQTKVDYLLSKIRNRLKKTQG